MGRRTLLLIASILVAALGTALIWLYVQGADNRAAAGTTQVQVLVATNTVKAGQPATQVKPEQRLMPQTLVNSLGGTLLTDPAQVKGFTRTDVVAGLPLLRDQFSAEAVAAAPLEGLPPNMVAMQVTLPDPQRLVGLLQPGSKIRVYAGLQDKNDDKKKYAAVLFNQVTVLQAGVPTTPAPAAPASSSGGTASAGTAPQVPQAIVTLALNNEQAKSLVFAQTSTGGSAALYFALLGANVTPDDKNSVDAVSPGVL
jgi:pilus assembly protein CpaB